MHFKLLRYFILNFLIFFGYLFYFGICIDSKKLKRASEMLLRNVERFHSDFNLKSSDQPLDSKFFIGHTVPDDIIYYILSFFDKNCVEKFKILSKNCLMQAQKHDVHQLRCLNPFFVFEDSWMNEIMLKYLKENFSAKVNLSLKNENESELCGIKDDLNLASIKFIRKKDDLNFASIKSFLKQDSKATMEFLILLFLFEIVYGPNVSMPMNQDQWKALFIQKLLNHDLPKCCQYYLILIDETLKRYNGNQLLYKKQIKDAIRFLRKQPSEAELLKYNFYFCANDAPELYLNLHLKFHKELVSDERLDLLLSSLAPISLFTQSILDRYPNDSRTLKSYLNLFGGPKIDVKFVKAIYEKLSLHKNENVSMKYLWTRDTLNQFDLIKFIDLKGHLFIQYAIIELISCSCLNLVQLDIFRQLIGIISYDFQAIYSFENSLQAKIFSSSPILFQIFLDEVRTPVNIFVKIKMSEELNYRLLEMQPANLLIYVKYVLDNGNDPLPVLFYFIFKISWLVWSDLIRPIIVDKFNLRKRYIFDGEFDDIMKSKSLISCIRPAVIASSQNFNSIGVFNGKTLTFKQIVDAVKIECLIDCFTSNPTDLDKEDYAEMELSRPISFFKFFNQGVLEPIDD